MRYASLAVVFVNNVIEIHLQIYFFFFYSVKKIYSFIKSLSLCISIMRLH